MVLAFSSYTHVRTLCDEGDSLNLAWTLDERSFLAVDLAEHVKKELNDEVAAGLPAVSTYAVQDPYGHEALSSHAANYFGFPSGSCQLICGAGVNSLLHALARLCIGGGAYVLGDVYPDFPHWVGSLAVTCVMDAEAKSLNEHGEAAARSGAKVFFLERPTFCDCDTSLAELLKLCELLEPSGCLVVVDESYGNYYPPSFSAANLISSAPNIAVLRGLSKAYWMGSLRLGYCLTSPTAAESIKAIVAPMLASSLSIKIGATILDLGDIFEPLRARIDAAKREVKAILPTSITPTSSSTDSCVPFLYFDSGDADFFEQAGIIGKMQPFWNGIRNNMHYRYRLSVPLLQRRMDLLRDLLGTRPNDASSNPKGS